MARKIERQESRRLYVMEKKTIKEISLVMNVPEKSLYRWAAEDKWDADREVIATSKVSTVRDGLMFIARKIETLLSDPANIPKGSVDELLKLRKLITGLEKDIDKRGNVLLGLQEIIEFMQNAHPDELLKWQPYLSEFSNHIAKKYSS